MGVGDVGDGGTLYQWQAPSHEEYDSAMSQFGSQYQNRDDALKHTCPEKKGVLVPLGPSKWKWK